MSRRSRYIAAAVLVGAFVLVQFQNCAPAGLGDNGEPDPGVRLVDEYGKAEIEFPVPQLSLDPVAAAVSLSGMCKRSRNGFGVTWSLVSAGGDPLAKGTAVCTSGGFAIRVGNLDSVPCGQVLQLRAEGAWGANAVTAVFRRCPATAVQVLTAGPELAADCFLEYGDSPHSCVSVCYRDGLTVWSRDEEAEKCAALAKSPAGP